MNGDTANSNSEVSGVLELAKKEGWVLSPQNSNPGSQDYIEPDIQDEILDYIKGK